MLSDGKFHIPVNILEFLFWDMVKLLGNWFIFIRSVFNLS